MNRPNVSSFISSIRKASQPAISPDGKHVAYVVTHLDPTSLASISNIWISDIDGTNLRQLTTGESYSSPIWTMDGKNLVYVGSLDDGTGFSINRISVEDGGSQEVGRTGSLPGDLALAPDGKTLAFVAQYDPTPRDEALGDLPPVRVINRLDYKEDGLGIPNERQFQIFTMDMTSGVVTRFTDSRHDHAALEWSPDGSILGATRRQRVGLTSQLLLIDIGTNAYRVSGPPDHAVRGWAWSPDGTAIALVRSPHPEFDGDFYLLDVATGSESRLTHGLDWCVDYTSQPLAWIDDTHVIASGYETARSGLWKLDTVTGELQRLRLDDAYRYGLATATGHATVVQHTGSACSTGDLIAIDTATGQATMLTDVNAPYIAAHPAGTIEEFATGNDGLTIHYMLKKPHDFDSARTYPVVFEIHGGPHMFRGYDIETSNQLLLDAGYLVVCPNPRGSISYGLDFTRGVLGDWGGGDWRDIVAVVDAVAAMPFVDEARLGIYGYSYGGYMSSWAIGQTDRFKAAVIGAPLTDLISRDGTSDIGYAASWLEYNGTLPDIHDMLVRQSPVTHMHKAVTPSLILHPEDDQRCPIGQSEQLFVGLMRAGVTTEFIRYPNESHIMPWTGPAAYRIDFYSRLLDWFERFL